MARPVDPELERFARMTPREKLRAAEQLYETARSLKAAGVRRLHPDWSEERVRRAVRDAFLLRPG